MAMMKLSMAALLTLVFSGIFVSLLASGLLIAYQRVPSTGTLIEAVEVGVYVDSGCTNNLTSIDWGLLTPGMSINKTVYIRNDGTKRIILSMTTDNWNSLSAQNYMSLSWNREDKILESGEVVQAVLILTVSPNISGIANFTFDIIIQGIDQ